MKAKNLSSEQIGVLKGILGTSLVFSLATAIGAYFWHQKHEEELDKLEKDTATKCLDIAAEHYEGVIRRREKAAERKSVSKTPYYEEFLEFQRKLDNTGSHEHTEEEWAELEKEINQQQKEHAVLSQKIKERRARLDIELDRRKLELLAEKAKELAAKEVPSNAN